MRIKRWRYGPTSFNERAKKQWWRGPGQSTVEEALVNEGEAIEYLRHVEPETMWRDRVTGMHYSAIEPRTGNDEAVSWRWKETVTKKLLGDFPELGTVFYSSNEPTFTARFPETTYGEWMHA